MFGEVQWCFTICTLFILVQGKVYMDIQGTKPSKTKVEYRKFNIIKDKGSFSRLEDVEPGFDFTDEEMKTLKIWPGGTIPYYIDEFSFDKVFRDRIRSFLDTINSVTGLNFLELHRPPGDDETRWVFFVNRQSLLNCIDHPYKDFTTEGVQKIVLGYDCLNGGEIAEVVLALVGVPPQHNAPDRDKYIQIEKDNILPGKEHLFEVLENNEWLFHEIEYDFGSASHYNLHKYTVNGKATIKPLGDVQDKINEGKGFSYKDIWKIKMIYNYISRKRLKSMNIPECNKLFNVDTNINNNQRESAEDVTPRKKPNKYLGLPDDEKESIPDNEDINDDDNLSIDKQDTEDEENEIDQEISANDDEQEISVNDDEQEISANDDEQEISANDNEDNIEIENEKLSVEESNDVDEDQIDKVADDDLQAKLDSEADYKTSQKLAFKKPGFG